MELVFSSTFTGVMGLELRLSDLTRQVLLEPSHQPSPPSSFLCVYVCWHVRGASEHTYMGAGCKSQVFLLGCYPQDLTCK